MHPGLCPRPLSPLVSSVGFGIWYATWRQVIHEEESLMTTIREAHANRPAMYNVTLITGHKAWTTTEKPTTVGGILEFTDGAGNRISVPQSAVWVEQPSRR